MVRSDQEKIIERDFLGLGRDTASSEASMHVYKGNRMCDASKHMYMNNPMYITDPRVSSQRHMETLVITKSNPEDVIQQPTASRWLYGNTPHNSNLDFAAMRCPDWSNSAGRQQFLSFNDSQPVCTGGLGNAVLSSTPLDYSLAVNSLTYQSGSRMNAFPFIAPRLQQSPAASDCWPAGQAVTPEPSASSHWPAGGTSTRMLPSDSCIKPSRQLTIFYAGKVNVYNDVTLIKAEEIMLMAAAGNSLPPKMDMSSTKSAPMVVPHVVGSQTSADPQDQMDLHAHSQPHHFKNDQCSLPATSVPHVPEVQGPKPSIQSAFLEDEPIVPRALPQARKASLARFLEKRKERVLSKSPYPVKETFR